MDDKCVEVSKGVESVSLDSETPIIFGVLTTENIEQAIERARTKAGVSSIEMIKLLKNI